MNSTPSATELLAQEDTSKVGYELPGERSGTLRSFRDEVLDDLNDGVLGGDGYRNPLVLYPDDDMKDTLDIILTIVAIYVFLFIPWQIAFANFRIKEFNIINWCMMLSYMFDVCAHCLETFIREDSTYEHDMRTVINHHLSDWRRFFDFFVVLANIFNEPLFWMFGFTRLWARLKESDLAEAVLRKLQSEFRTETVKLIKYLFMSLLGAHVFACFWFAIGERSCWRDHMRDPRNKVKCFTGTRARPGNCTRDDSNGENVLKDYALSHPGTDRIVCPTKTRYTLKVRVDDKDAYWNVVNYSPAKSSSGWIMGWSGSYGQPDTDNGEKQCVIPFPDPNEVDAMGIVQCKYSFLDDYWAKQWLVSIYYIFTTATTVGYGDVGPTTAHWEEVLFTIFLQISGVIMFGVVVGLIATVFAGDSDEDVRIQNQMKALIKWLHAGGIGGDLATEVCRKMEPIYRIHKPVKELQVSQICANMPDDLLTKVQDKMFGDVRRDCILFTGVPAKDEQNKDMDSDSSSSDVAEIQLRDSLVDLLNPVLISSKIENKQIFGEGKAIKNVYILDSGTAEAYYKRALDEYNSVFARLDIATNEAFDSDEEGFGTQMSCKSTTSSKKTTPHMVAVQRFNMDNGFGRNTMFEVIGLHEGLTSTPNSKWNYTVLSHKRDSKPLKWWKIEITKFQSIIREPKYKEIHEYLLEMGLARRKERLKLAKALFEGDGMFSGFHGTANDAFQADVGKKEPQGPAVKQKAVTQQEVFSLFKNLGGGNDLQAIISLGARLQALQEVVDRYESQPNSGETPRSRLGIPASITEGNEDSEAPVEFAQSGTFPDFDQDAETDKFE